MQVGHVVDVQNSIKPFLSTTSLTPAMFRSQAIRISRSAVVAPSRPSQPRSYTTGTAPPPPPPSNDPSSTDRKGKGSSSSGLLYAVLGLGAAAGGYYYYTEPERFEALKGKVKTDEEEMLKKVREAKAQADEKYKTAQAKYGPNASAQAADLRQTVTGKVNELEERARQASQAGQAKAQAEARDAVRAVEQKVEQVKSDVEKRSEKAKAGWFSWLRWGKSKADVVKDEAAAKTADGVEAAKKNLK